MVIAKSEWFEGKECSYLERYDVTWQGAVYFAVMFGFPLILGFIFLPSIIVIVAGYYQNIDLVLIFTAWLVFSIGDFMDVDYVR